MEKKLFKFIIGFLAFETGGVQGAYYTFEVNNCCCNDIRDMDPCCFDYCKPDIYMRMNYCDGISDNYVFQGESTCINDDSNPSWGDDSWGFSIEGPDDPKDLPCRFQFNMFDQDVGPSDYDDYYGWAEFGCNQLYAASGNTLTTPIMGPDATGSLTCHVSMYKLESAADASNFTHLS